MALDGECPQGLPLKVVHSADSIAATVPTAASPIPTLAPVLNPEPGDFSFDVVVVAADFAAGSLSANVHAAVLPWLIEE